MNTTISLRRAIPSPAEAAFSFFRQRSLQRRPLWRRFPGSPSSLTLLYLFSDTQFRRSGPRILFHLPRRGENRFFCHRSEKWTLIANANGKVRRTDTPPFSRLKSTLADAVLQRMEGNHANPSALAKPLDRLVQGRGKGAQLIVDGDADRLKRAAGGMGSATAGSSG